MEFRNYSDKSKIEWDSNLAQSNTHDWDKNEHTCTILEDQLNLLISPFFLEQQQGLVWSYGVGRETTAKQLLVQAAQPPPAARKHPAAAMIPNGPVTAPKGRPVNWNNNDGKISEVRGMRMHL